MLIVSADREIYCDIGFSTIVGIDIISKSVFYRLLSEGKKISMKFFF